MLNHTSTSNIQESPNGNSHNVAGITESNTSHWDYKSERRNGEKTYLIPEVSSLRTRAIVRKNTTARANRDREGHLLSAAITDLSLEREITRKKKFREKKEEEEEEEEEQRKRVVMSVKALDKTDLL